jgi:hypothetical protein
MNSLNATSKQPSKLAVALTLTLIARVPVILSCLLSTPVCRQDVMRLMLKVSHS